MKILRSNLNAMIERAKRSFIKNSLKMNTKNPKKFWRIINDMIKNENTISVSEIEFCYLDNDIPVKDADVPNYLNNYFATIATRNRIFHFNSVSKNE